MFLITKLLATPDMMMMMLKTLDCCAVLIAHLVQQHNRVPAGAVPTMKRKRRFGPVLCSASGRLCARYADT